MKIAFISHTSQLAGAEKILINMASLLNKKDDTDIFLFAYGDGPMHSYADDKNIKYIALKYPLPWYLFIKDHIQEISSHWNDVQKSVDELTELYNFYGIECVVINTMTNMSGYLAAANLNLPSILWIHGIIDHVLLPESGNDFKLACDRILLNGATQVICPTNWIKNHYVNFRKDVQIVPNFTEVPESILVYPNDNKTVFSCLNTWNHAKGLDCLIEAAEIVKNKNKEFELNLYGNGDLEDYMESLIRQKKLMNHVKLQGRTNDIKEVFQNTHALITASRIESFGMTLIEAMSYARPIIVSDNSGHLEILEDGKFGFFCETDSSQSFAEKMEWIIDNRQQSKELGIAGYRNAKEKFNGDLASERLYEIIRSIIDSEIDLSIFTKLNRYMLSDLIGSLYKPLLCKANLVNEVENNNIVIQLGEPLSSVKLSRINKYNIVIPFNVLNQISFQIGTHNIDVQGSITMYLSIHNNVIRKSEVTLINVSDNAWVTFNFSPLYNVKNKELQIKLELKSDNVISIYEATKYSTVISKLKRRIGGRGALCCKIL